MEDKIVYGNIGRFENQKNHTFLIDIFYELQKRQDAVLLLAGNGKLEESIKEKVKQLNIEKKVFFLGFRTDIGSLLCAMDYFIFPSIHEGLPVSLVEAQTSGLPIFVSRGVPDEANISNNFYKINSYGVSDWVYTILNSKKIERKNAYKDTINAGFDIRQTAKQLEQVYKGLIK